MMQAPPRGGPDPCSANDRESGMKRLAGRTAIGIPCDVTDRPAVEDLTETGWDDTMAVSTKGAFPCCREAIMRMREAGRGGRLVDIASGQPSDGITVNAICPGIIRTRMRVRMIPVKRAGQTINVDGGLIMS